MLGSMNWHRLMVAAVVFLYGASPPVVVATAIRRCKQCSQLLAPDGVPPFFRLRLEGPKLPLELRQVEEDCSRYRLELVIVDDNHAPRRTCLSSQEQSYS